MRNWSVLFVVLSLAPIWACDQRASRSTGDTATPASETVQVDPRDLIFCDVVRKRLTADDCEDAKVVAAKVETGLGAFNVQKTMERGRTVTLQLAVGRKEEPPVPPAPPPPAPTDSATPPPESATSPAADTAPPTERPPPSSQTPAEVVGQLPGEVIEYAPVIGREMSADLIGEGFKIAPQSPRIQTVSAVGVTTWDWAVTPLTSGVRTLSVKTAVVFTDSQGKSTAIANTPRNVEVRVKVGPLGLIEDVLAKLPGWLKAVAAVLTALGGLLLAWRGAAGAFGGRAAPAEPDKPGGDAGRPPTPPPPR